MALVDNLLYPVLIGRQLRLHTLAAFVAIVGGLVAFGGTGLVNGPLGLALGVALLEVWKSRINADRDSTAADGTSVDPVADELRKSG